MTSGERISQLHDVARSGELRKGLRLVDDLQTNPPVFTGRTSSNTPGANGGRSSSHSRTTARGIGRCASSSRVGTTTWHSSSQKTASPCGCPQGTYAGTDGQGQTQPPPRRHFRPLLTSAELENITATSPWQSPRQAIGPACPSVAPRVRGDSRPQLGEAR